jgi:adenylate kinase
MAVKIDIPGIGEVTADNFAQEDTLQKLLAVMGKSEKTKRAEEQKRIVQEKELSKLKKEEAEQIKNSAKK